MNHLQKYSKHRFPLCQLFISILTLALFVGVASSNDSITGVGLYTGTCKNVTHSIEGHIKLILREEGSNVSGYISIGGWLVGSGPVSGTKQGNRYTFESIDDVYGTKIRWQGKMKEGKLEGEYYVAKEEASNKSEEVGEWLVEGVTEIQSGFTQEDQFVEVTKLLIEISLNQLVKTDDGNVVTGAQAIFDTAHPIGTGVSVVVGDITFKWKDDAFKAGTLEEVSKSVHKFELDYVVFWHGIINRYGWTHLRMVYNAELDAITHHVVVESTGTTKSELSEMAYGLGYFIGRTAMGAVLGGQSE